MKEITDRVRFDDSLSEMVELLAAELGLGPVEAGRVLRDVEGRLTFISPSVVGAVERERLGTLLGERLGGYARGSANAFLDPESPVADLLLRDSRVTVERVALREGGPVCVTLLDRRIAGADWLSAPAPGWTTPPGRLVFSSLKGGVGRSTALAVLALDLTRTGHRVLAIDLDLEAPGLGELLVHEEDRAPFGALDWFVEAGLSGADAGLLDGLVAPSRLRAGNGLIEVAAAVGTRSDAHPANVLAKLARAYVGGGDGAPATFLDATRLLVEQLTDRRPYDAVLIDARAGLNETTAASFLGLGADVLLFGLDTRQTFAANRYLLGHLARFPRTEEDDWLLRVKMVHAKASASLLAQKRFRDRAFEAFDELVYRDVPLGEDPTVDSADDLVQQEFGLDDPDAPHHAWVVLSDSNFQEFDPLAEPRLATPEVYVAAFGAFLTESRERLQLTGAA